MAPFQSPITAVRRLISGTDLLFHTHIQGSGRFELGVQCRAAKCDSSAKLALTLGVE